MGTTLLQQIRVSFLNSMDILVKIFFGTTVIFLVQHTIRAEDGLVVVSNHFRKIEMCTQELGILYGSSDSVYHNALARFPEIEYCSFIKSSGTVEKTVFNSKNHTNVLQEINFDDQQLFATIFLKQSFYYGYHKQNQNYILFLQRPVSSKLSDQAFRGSVLVKINLTEMLKALAFHYQCDFWIGLNGKPIFSTIQDSLGNKHFNTSSSMIIPGLSCVSINKVANIQKVQSSEKQLVVNTHSNSKEQPVAVIKPSQMRSSNKKSSHAVAALMLSFSRVSTKMLYGIGIVAFCALVLMIFSIRRSISGCKEFIERQYYWKIALGEMKKEIKKIPAPVTVPQSIVQSPTRIIVRRDRKARLETTPQQKMNRLSQRKPVMK